MCVDGAVEDEIKREVDRLEEIKNGDSEVVQVGCFAGCHVAEEVQHFGGNEEDDVHDDDDDQRQGDPVGDVAVPAGCACIRPHLGRSTQGEAQVGVAEDQDRERMTIPKKK